MIAEATVMRLSEEYPDLIRDVLEYGTTTETRIGRTKEFISFVMTLREPQHCIIRRQGFSRTFLDLEIEMLLAGEYDGKLVRSITPKAADLLAPATAYGPRIESQLPEVEEELHKDPLSRRAVVYVGRHSDLWQTHVDPEKYKNEMPCTMTWQFLIRDHRLHMLVNMRSWDLVWGLSYDVPNFVAVQMAMAEALLCDVGYYYHVAGSAHVYEQHWDMDAQPNPDGELEVPWIQPTIDQTMHAAREQLALRKESMHVSS